MIYLLHACSVRNMVGNTVPGAMPRADMLSAPSEHIRTFTVNINAISPFVHSWLILFTWPHLLDSKKDPFIP